MLDLVTLWFLIYLLFTVNIDEHVADRRARRRLPKTKNTKLLQDRRSTNVQIKIM